MTTLQELEARMKRLEDVEAIKRVKYLYCYYSDQQDVDKLMTCFASDCRVELGLGRRAAGKKDVAALFAKAYTVVTFADHMVHNPLIDVRGDTATGTWYVHVPNTVNGVACWTQGVYEEEYVREDGEWKIKSEVIRMHFVTPFDKGWVREKTLEGLTDKYASLMNSLQG